MILEASTNDFGAQMHTRPDFDQLPYGLQRGMVFMGHLAT
jgi:hypothetical protein